MSAVCLEYNLTYPRGPHGAGLAGWTVLVVVAAPAASFMECQLCVSRCRSPVPARGHGTPHRCLWSCYTGYIVRFLALFFSKKHFKTFFLNCALAFRKIWLIRLTNWNIQINMKYRTCHQIKKLFYILWIRSCYVMFVIMSSCSGSVCNLKVAWPSAEHLSLM